VQRRFEKALLVCSSNCGAVRECLAHGGCEITEARDGKSAVAKARRAIFDAAVIVSTGTEMDLAETVFNLRDVRSSMEIVIVPGGDEMGGEIIGEIAAAVPNVVVADIGALRALLEMPLKERTAKA
jgi:DNA-binding response OmpR family regulator